MSTPDGVAEALALAAKKGRRNQALTDAVKKEIRKHRQGVEEDLRHILESEVRSLKDMLAGEMSKEEAVAFADSGWWEAMDSREAARIQLHQPRCVMPIDLFQNGLELLLGRPIFTHELGNPKRLIAELEGRAEPPASPFHSLSEAMSR